MKVATQSDDAFLDNERVQDKTLLAAVADPQTAAARQANTGEPRRELKRGPCRVAGAHREMLNVSLGSLSSDSVSDLHAGEEAPRRAIECFPARSTADDRCAEARTNPAKRRGLDTSVVVAHPKSSVTGPEGDDFAREKPKDDNGPVGRRDPGQILFQLRVQLQKSPSDIELESAEIAIRTRNRSFLLSHSHLHQIETENSVPGIFKLCSLAACLDLSLEEILGIYGVDISLLRERYGLRVTECTDHLCMDTREPMSLREVASASDDTRLVPRHLQERLLLPFLSRLSDDRHRYTFGVVGKDNGSDADEIPPGSVVQIDRKYQLNDGTLKRLRPIYFIWSDHGYICAPCDLSGKDLTIIPFDRKRELVRLKIPRDAEIIGRVDGVIRFVGGP